MKPSSTLKSLQEQQAEAEPTLDALMPQLDLADPKVKSFLQKVVREAKAASSNSKPEAQ